MDHHEIVDSSHLSEIAQVSDIRFTPSQPGSVRCRAKNRLGSDHGTGYVKLGDLERPFMVTGIRNDQKIAAGDFVRLECGAIIYNYSSNVVWLRDGVPMDHFADITVEENNTKFSWRKSITFKQIEHENEGIYTCEVYEKGFEESEPVDKEQVVIKVHDAEVPTIITNFNQSVMQHSLGGSVKLDCLVSGLPAPSLIWYKNDEVFSIEDSGFENNTMQRIMIDNGNSSIMFNVLRLEDVGTYKCVAWNRVGEDFKEVKIEIPSEYGKPFFLLSLSSLLQIFIEKPI